jgi:carboxymethylenebutenolidase
MADIQTQKLEIPVAGAGPMPAFLAAPSGAGPFPAVLVLEEIFGVNSHIRDVTERIAREGYVAIAPDYHHRAWPPGTEYGYDDEGVQKGRQVIAKFSAAGLTADLDATIAFLRTHEQVRGDRLGCIGFCIGGHAAYFAAATQPILVTASFYGGAIATHSIDGSAPTVERGRTIKGRIVCFFGDKDNAIPLEQVRLIGQVLKEHHVRHEVVVYEDCTHGFFCDQRGSYNPKAAADAWERVKKLFAEELKR